jgi:hypothetical protein
MRASLISLFILVSALCLSVASAKDKGAVSSTPEPHKSMKGPYLDGPAVTKDCLKCHEEKAREILNSAHWLWRGPSPFVEDHERSTDLGKRNLLNNF